jgi:hypothetical protein
VKQSEAIEALKDRVVQLEQEVAGLREELAARPVRRQGHRAGSVRGNEARMPADGTVLTGRYRGQVYTCTVDGGQFVVDGVAHGTPSAAAVAIIREVTGDPNRTANGWDFWGINPKGEGGGRGPAPEADQGDLTGDDEGFACECGAVYPSLDDQYACLERDHQALVPAGF